MSHTPRHAPAHDGKGNPYTHCVDFARHALEKARRCKWVVIPDHADLSSHSVSGSGDATETRHMGAVNLPEQVTLMIRLGFSSEEIREHLKLSRNAFQSVKANLPREVRNMSRGRGRRKR